MLIRLNSPLNTMCMDCMKLQTGCKGTSCQTWTGCIYKEKIDNEVMNVKKKQSIIYKT